MVVNSSVVASCTCGGMFAVPCLARCLAAIARPCVSGANMQGGAWFTLASTNKDELIPLDSFIRTPLSNNKTTKCGKTYTTVKSFFGEAGCVVPSLVDNGTRSGFNVPTLSVRRLSSDPARSIKCSLLMMCPPA